MNHKRNLTQEVSVMKSTSIERCIKGIIIGFAICGVLVYALILPAFGNSLRIQYPEFAHWYHPWLVFLWITVIPCYLVLISAWKVAGNIGDGHSFSYENGISFKRISLYACADSIFFFAGNILFWLMGINHPGIVVLSLLIVFFGLSISLASKALSQLVDEAAGLQEECDLTI